MIPFFILAIVAFTTVFFAGIHLWVQSLLIFSIFGLSAAVLWAWVIRMAVKRGDQTSGVLLDPVSVCGLLFLLWAGLQLLPLPEGVLRILSPNTRAAWETTAMAGGNGPFPISLYPYLTLNSLIFGVALLLFYLLILYGVRARSRVHVLVSGLLALGTLVSLYALVQAGTGSPYILWWKADSADIARGTFVNRNHLAAFLSMLVCLGVGYTWALGKEKEGMGWGKASGTLRVIVLLGAALMMAAVLTTASRGGVLSLLGALIFMVGMLLARFLRKRSAYVLILMVSVVTIYVSYMGLYRVMDRFQYFRLGFQDRLELIRPAYEMGKTFPLTGGGLGTFESVYPGFQRELFDQAVDYAHNDWVQLFAETGWPGLVLFGGGFVWLMIVSLSRWRGRRDAFSVGIGLGGMGAVVGMAIHSLSDFNLHMPANALVLASILAITRVALSPKGSRGEEPLSLARWKIRPAAWMAIGIAALVTFGGAVMAREILRTWRADILARAFENSTLPLVEPADSDLKRAWALAPGEVTYWAWLAIRDSMRSPGGRQSVNMLWEQGTDSIARAMDIQRNVAHAWPQGGAPAVDASARKELFAAGDGVPAKDPELYLLGEAIKRNPTNWSVWRQMGWAAFCKADQDPGYYFPIALRAMENARAFRPYSPQQELEYGIIGLSAYWLWPEGVDEESWKSAFRQVLSSKPDWAPGVVDLLILNLGEEGGNEVKGLLPDDARTFVLAAGALAKWGALERGLEILKEGEQKRKQEIETLWSAYAGKGRVGYRGPNQGPRNRKPGDEGKSDKGNSGSPRTWIRLAGGPGAEEPERILEEILTLDPQHPAGMLARGKIVESLKCQDRRSGRIGELGDLKRISSALTALDRQKKESPLDIAYLRAKVLLEDGSPREAGEQLKQTLRIGPQYFPAWVQALALMERERWAELDGSDMERFRRKVEMFQMDRVVADAWQWGGVYEGWPSWVAPVRNARERKNMTLQFMPNGPALWKLMVDGQFAAAWAGGLRKEPVEFALPAGEHLFRVVGYGDLPLDVNKKLPFNLEVKFK